MVTRQLQVDRKTKKVRRPKTDVLPLYHATNYQCSILMWPLLAICCLFQ